MRWQKKLTKKQMKHLRDSNVPTLSAFKLLREGQKKVENENKDKDVPLGGRYPCYECYEIAKKLGLEE